MVNWTQVQESSYMTRIALCLLFSVVAHWGVSSSFAIPSFNPQATKLPMLHIAFQQAAPAPALVPQPEPEKQVQKAPEVLKPIVAKSPEKQPPKKKDVKRVEKPAPKKQQQVAALPVTGAGKEKQNVIPVIKDPNHRHMTPPHYPMRAAELGQQGEVLLYVLVDEYGETKDIKVEASSGHRLLDSAALRAVQDWKFEPAMKDGQAILSWVEQPVNFTLQ